MSTITEINTYNFERGETTTFIKKETVIFTSDKPMTLYLMSTPKNDVNSIQEDVMFYDCIALVEDDNEYMAFRLMHNSFMASSYYTRRVWRLIPDFVFNKYREEIIKKTREDEAVNKSHDKYIIENFVGDLILRTENQSEDEDKEEDKNREQPDLKFNNAYEEAAYHINPYKPLPPVSKLPMKCGNWWKLGYSSIDLVIPDSAFVNRFTFYETHSYSKRKYNNIFVQNMEVSLQETAFRDCLY